MSVNIDFFKFSKRTNSTKRPGTPAVTLTANLKAPCSILNPVLELATDPTEYNYCYIDKFKRYYFVGDIEFNRGLWIVPLAVDVLASYKPQIGSFNGYVLRSASARNEYILDNSYINTAVSSYDSNTVTDTVITWDDGVYIVNILSSSGSGNNSYQFTPADFARFYGAVNTAIDGFNWEDIPNALRNQTLSPLQYITSCYWFPKAFSGTDVREVRLGLTRVSCTAKEVTMYGFRTYDLNVPKHPQAASIGAYCNLAPYSVYNLIWGPLGSVQLNSAILINAPKIRVSEAVDPVTGIAQITCTAMNANNKLLGVLVDTSVGWGVPVALSAQQQTGSSLTAIGKAASALGAWAVTGVGFGGVLASAASAAGEMIATQHNDMHAISSAGSLVAHNTVKSIEAVFYQHVGVDIANNGRPLCEKRVINTLSGYTVLQSGQLDIDTTAAEREQIRLYLEGGFYYE